MPYSISGEGDDTQRVTTTITTKPQAIQLVKLELMMLMVGSSLAQRVHAPNDTLDNVDSMYCITLVGPHICPQLCVCVCIYQHNPIV